MPAWAFNAGVSNLIGYNVTLCKPLFFFCTCSLCTHNNTHFWSYSSPNLTSFYYNNQCWDIKRGISHFIHHRPLHLTCIHTIKGISINSTILTIKSNTDCSRLTIISHLKWKMKDVNIIICSIWFICRPGSQHWISINFSLGKYGSNILHVSVHMSYLEWLAQPLKWENEMDCPWTVTSRVNFS